MFHTYHFGVLNREKIWMGGGFMGYIGPVRPYQYQEYDKRILTRRKQHDPMPISATEKVPLLTPFQRILNRKQSNNQQTIRKKAMRDKNLSRKSIYFNEFDFKTKGRHFNEYV